MTTATLPRPTRSPVPGTPAALAADISAHIDRHFPPEQAPIRQVLALAEEAGEFVGAYRRWAGMARRTGSWTDVEAELADVVITAYLAAHVLGIDLDGACHHKAQVIATRGWKDPR